MRIGAIILFLFVPYIYGLDFPQSNSITHIPVIESPSEGNSDYYVILYTGNGGWRKLVQSVTKYLNIKGISVLAINSKKYFLLRKNPEKIASDL